LRNKKTLGWLLLLFFLFQINSSSLQYSYVNIARVVKEKKNEEEEEEEKTWCCLLSRVGEAKQSHFNFF
jgi:hypothetical protein